MTRDYPMPRPTYQARGNVPGITLTDVEAEKDAINVLRPNRRYVSLVYL